jgi:hypothetical protein
MSSNDIAAAAEPADSGKVSDAEPDTPRPTDNPGQPGGPAPPDGRAA